MEETAEKILYISTHGKENPERASVPFVLANAALAMDIQATVVLQGDAVTVAQKGVADDMPAGGGFPPIKKLIQDFLELGGEMWVCVPCIESRNIDEADLIEGAVTTAGGKVNLAAIAANAVFTY
ncbi:DsrE family protein [Desulfosarcina variabilis str. Montpellier]|uniref:DsrE family protein n=1 Tax=Desulfosarcina variabilis TaxID=2300 RepID=UPI003AFACB34